MYKPSLRDRWVKPFFIINSLYLMTFFVTMNGLLPLQSRFTPDFASYASLLFLPHGVRVLSAWLYGWRAIILVAPSALFTHFLNFGGDGFELDGLLGAFSGVTCAALTFWLLSLAGLDFRLSKQKTANWRDLMIAGSVASIFNTYGMGIAFDHNLATLSGYLIGDITGLFACMFALMLIFKLERQFRTPI